MVRWPGQNSQVSCNFCKCLLHRMEVCMCVDIQCHADIGVSHKILQTFYINAPLLHIRTEGMPQNMRCHRWKRIAINTIDFLLDTSHVVLQVHSYLWHTGFIKEDDTTIAVYNPFRLADGSVLHNSLQGQINSVRHGDRSHTAGCLGTGDEIWLLCCPA